MPRALARHVLADVLPQVAEHGHLVAGDVLGDGDAGQLHDAGLDGVHEREVAHRPREQRALGVARPAQEEGSRREVDHPREAELAVHRLQAGDPEAGGLVVALGLLAVVALQVVVLVVVGRLLAVAVVRLVVEDEDVPEPHQLGHDALEHLPLGLERLQILTHPALEQRPPTLRQLQPLPALEGVVVGDDDLGAVHVVQHVAGYQLAARVVAVRVAGVEDAKTVLDRDPRGDDEEAAGEALALRPPDGVDGLPGDEHGHDRRLARPRGQLERQAQQLRVGVGVCVRPGARGTPSPAARCGATSVSQIAVSTASIWQKKGRTPVNSWCRQCWSSRAVSGVTPQALGLPMPRHWSTRRRSSLMTGVGSYCCVAVETPAPSSKTSRSCPARRLCFFGLGMGVMNWAVRRASTIRPVGCPSASSSQWRAGCA